LSVIKRLQEMIDYLAGHGYDIIIYTNNNGYRRFVQSSFADYPLWLCRFTTPQEDVEWQFWQYSHWGEVDGIKGDVDLNIFNGSSYDFAQWLK
ncbi:MAG: GH25 family lysozyme, partial [Muribaculaceae bacterium]